MADRQNEIERLRLRMERVNADLLELLNERARLVERIFEVKQRQGLALFAPQREQAMLEQLLQDNSGPFSDAAVRRLFHEIFSASRELMEVQREGELKVSRARNPDDRVFQVRGRQVGLEPILVAGPCSVESQLQLEQVARCLVQHKVGFMRGGAFKPRSSPYTFQGLGRQGLELLQDVGRRHDLVTVSEVLDTRAVELVGQHVDVLQVGARSMYNYELLREVGRSGKPVLLKRGLSATLDELLLAAEYIADQGNDQIILCERGIRTFEPQTRNTLDISAVPLLRQLSHLPVLVDVSHAAGRGDILAPLGRAALAAGANGLMVEVHPSPWQARSDGQQQLDLEAFAAFVTATGFGP